MRCRILLSESKLQIVDNIIVIGKTIQSFTYTFFKYFFQYLVKWRLDNSYYTLIFNLLRKTWTVFAVLSTNGKQRS